MNDRKITMGEGVTEGGAQSAEQNFTQKTNNDKVGSQGYTQGQHQGPEAGNVNPAYRDRVTSVDPGAPAGSNIGAGTGASRNMSNSYGGEQAYGGYQQQTPPQGPGGMYQNVSSPNPNMGGPNGNQNYSGYRHVMPQTGVGAGGGPGGPSGPGRVGGPAPAYNVPPQNKKNNSKVAYNLLIFVLVAVIGLGAGFGGGMIAASRNSAQTSANTITIEGGTDALNAAKAISAKVMPSVVGISTQQEETYQNLFGYIQKGIVSGVGTGLIVDASGYILTNSHVINDGSVDKISVDLYDGRELEGSVLWSDASLDLAIVKISADNLIAAELGDSDQVSIGDYAVAIGNPLGLNFERSVTQGIISGLNRTITTSDGTTNTNTVQMEGLIQTDASINSGNSGGPLINSEGKVIGINTAKAQSAEGLGFAIPINTAIPIIDEIKQTGEFKKGYIGISGMDLSKLKAYYQAVDFGTDIGVYIQQIYTESPAAEGGLKEGDIIIAINDETVETMTQLQTKLVEYRPGDQVELTYIRDKIKGKTKVTLGESIQ